MLLFRPIRPCSILGFFIIFALQPSYATTSNELINALNIEAQATVNSHSLMTATETSFGSCQVSADNSLADIDENSITISNGIAQDGGFGDTDWVCSSGDGAGLPDYTQFQMDIEVPAGSKSLVFRTQFVTSEYLSQSGDIKDRAYLYITLKPSNQQFTVDVSDIKSVSDKISPAVLRSLNVDGIENIELSFRIEDKVDGASDSALKVMDFHFSDEATSGDQAEYLPEDVKLPPGTYRYSKQLLHVPGKGIPLDFTVHYNSRNSRTRYFFRKWTHSYEQYMYKLDPDDGRLLMLGGDGGAIYFCPTATVGTYGECNGSTDASFENTLAGISSRVVANSDGTYTYTNREQLEYGFSAGGFLKLIEDTNNNQLNFSYFFYQGPSSSCQGRNYLDNILDTRGGTLKLYYSTDPTNFCRKMLVSMEYIDKTTTTLHFLSTTYQLVKDCYNQNVLDLAYVDAPEGRTTLSYDCSGNLLTATDPDGIITKTNTYAGERVATSMDGKGAVESYKYVADSLERTDRLGRVHYNYFDIQDRLIRSSNPLGESWLYTHDASGNIISQTDPIGNMTTMAYDSRGNMLSTTDALGNVSSMTYDTHNKLITATDPAGNSTTFTYDGSDNLLQETNPNGHSNFYGYYTNGLIQTHTDRRGSLFQYTYTVDGDLETETDPLGNTSSYIYDTEGRLTLLTDENGNSTNYAYDAAGNLLSLTPPNGATILYTYDSQGRQLSMEKANGAITAYTYSGTGKMLQYTDPLGNIFGSSYDAEDQLVTKTDPLGRITSFNYNLAGRMVQATDALGGTTRATYDAVGNRTSVTNPNENTTLYEYDLLGRITSETDPLGNTFTNFYDSKGLLDSVSNARGQSIKFHYDPAGRLVQTDFPEYTRWNTLDANGNEVQTIGKKEWTERSFDPMDRIVSRTDSFGNTIGYSYDPAGNLSSLTYSDGKTVQYSYDSQNRLVTVTDWDNNETSYTYDNVGHLLSTTLPDGSIVTSTYDIAGQLIRITETAQDSSTIFDAEYVYNGAGLRTSAEYHTVPLKPAVMERATGFTYNGANQLSQVDGQVFAYDQDGNMVTGLIGAVTKNMEYDELNRLTKVGQDTYEYDSEGLRVQATIEGKTTRYVQDPNAPYSRLLEEHDDQGNIIARYVYGVGLISRQMDAGDVSVYHYDSRGSTIALTNLSGNITDRYAYTPYGQQAGRTGDTTNKFTYNGRDGVMDDNNGLYYMRARYYEPRLMRFIQKDTATSGNMMDPQSLNRYAYVRGNPVQFVDPSGEILPIIAAAGFGVATEIAFDWATGEFNPLEDDWGVYLENNWVDLSIGAVTGGWGKIRNLKKLDKLADAKKMADIYKKSKKLLRVKQIRKFTSKTLRKFDSLQGFGIARNVAVNIFEKTILYPALGIKNYTKGYEYLAEGYEEHVKEHVEGAVDTVADAANSAGSWIEDTWNSIF